MKSDHRSVPLRQLRAMNEYQAAALDLLHLGSFDSCCLLLDAKIIRNLNVPPPQASERRAVSLTPAKG